MDIKTIATGFVRPKTTSLFFDKIWIPGSFRNSYIGEMMGYADIPLDVRFLDNEDFKKFSYSDHWNYANIKHLKEKEEIDFLFSYGRNTSIVEIVNYFKRKYKVNIVPIYFDKTEFEKMILESSEIIHYSKYDFIDNEGNKLYLDKRDKKRINIAIKNLKKNSGISMNAIEICIKFIPEILEDKLEWKQIEEIRKDKKSVESLKRFWRWFNIEIKDKTYDEVEEILQTKLEDYEFALRKHGVLTVIGGFTTILSSASTFISAILSNKLELIPAGLAVSAEIFTITSEQVAEVFQNRREPIAYVYKLIDKVNKTR